MRFERHLSEVSTILYHKKIQRELLNEVEAERQELDEKQKTEKRSGEEGVAEERVTVACILTVTDSIQPPDFGRK